MASLQLAGEAVWDVLLHDPRITAPEIMRMVRNPKLSKHLLETITGNPGWLGSSELRRAQFKNQAISGACSILHPAFLRVNVDTEDRNER
jgi:hypothetical protein